MVKPNKTAADYLVMSVSPVLIMLLVGSLSYFLVEVFYRGDAIGSVRWVLFWFVMAVVLVSRIGIEKGVGYAGVYGLGLAVATWLYLVRIHPAFIVGMILLGSVWWCAHKLTWDCTLIDEDEDASGNGLLQTETLKKGLTPVAAKVITAKPAAKGQVKAKAKKAASPHPPGLWVVYFSLAALPLFGVGQMLLPRGDLQARRVGFYFLFVYVAAALGLLLTTSFLGLRRYLRQRFLPMPGTVAFGWIRFGAGVAVFVLIGALLVPRPGGSEAWMTLRYQIGYQLRKASEYAASFSPHGKGKGKSGDETENSDTDQNSATAQPDQGPGQAPKPDPNGITPSQQPSAEQSFAERASQLYRWFRILFLLALAALLGWWIFSKRKLIYQMAQAFIAAIKKFFNDLFGFSFRRSEEVPVKQAARRRLFAAYGNPFLLGKDGRWTFEQLVAYSFEALQAWAEERQAAPLPQQTAREFCAELGGRFPEMVPELERLSFFYSYAAYGMAPPADRDLEPLKKLWRFLSE